MFQLMAHLFPIFLLKYEEMRAEPRLLQSIAHQTEVKMLHV